LRKPIIAGNWKMNKTLPEALAFTEEVKHSVPGESVVDSVICAPALFLERLVEATKGTRVKIGAQNMHLKKAVLLQARSARLHSLICMLNMSSWDTLNAVKCLMKRMKQSIKK